MMSVKNPSNEILDVLTRCAMNDKKQFKRERGEGRDHEGKEQISILVVVLPYQKVFTTYLDPLPYYRIQLLILVWTSCSFIMNYTYSSRHISKTYA